MIILYDVNEQSFTTLGLGVLKDTISCEVVEELNGSYELEMEYPITGQHYSDIEVNKIILTKSNPYDTIGEPFRIYKITKPINGVVTISAQHISYDLSGYTVEPFKGDDLDDTLSKIQNGTIISSPFTFTRGSDKTNVQTEFEIKQPYSQRGILAGSEGSVLDIYKGEFVFSRFNVTLFNHRGADRGICIRYGKNMTDIEQEINFEKGYTGVYPYYANTVTETKTTETMVYEQVYIVDGETAFSKDWFSLSEGPNNKPLLPILHDSPVQCATEGDYFEHIFIWHTITDPISGESHDEYVDVTSTAETDYPPNRKSVNTYNEESYEFITLTEKVIYINQQSVHQNILTLDLTGEFSDVPTEDQLRTRANRYITDNKLGEPTSTIKVSFVKLSDSPEYEQFKSLETVKLGDTVKVEYVALGVSTTLQVISYNYNAITNLYSEIELGTKTSTLSDTVLVSGDTISSLTNDKGYTDKTTVNELIAKMITADYIEALSATFTDVQIKDLLTTDSIRTRIIEASQFDIDYLVAEKLVANDAEIYDTLTAGNIKVRGDIDVLAGSITITGSPETIDTYLTSDTTIETFDDGWLCSDPEGTMPISHPVVGPSPFYIVKTAGTYFNKIYRFLDGRYVEWYNTTTFEVDRYGNVRANSVELEGYIKATAGDIGGCEIIDGQLHVPVAYIDGTIYADAIKLDYNSTYGGYNVSIDGNGIDIGIIGSNSYNFSVDDDGVVNINRGEINLGYNGTGYNFSVDDDGNVYASSLELAGGSINIEAVTVLCEENSSIEPYTRNWLKDASTHTTIIPKEYVNYLLEGYEVTATFGTSGNYKSVLADELEDSELVEHTDYEDNSTDNTQFKEGRVLKVHVLEGGYVTLTGYPNYSHYTFTVNGITTSELNGTNTSATATKEQDILITALTSNNYYISLFVKNTEDQYFKWNGTQYEKTYRIPSSFEVDEFGTLTTNNANIRGYIEATSGNIGGCEIIDGIMKVPTVQLDGVISANAINLGNGQFTVDTNGVVTIKNGILRLGYNSQYSYYNIEIDNYGINVGYDMVNDYYNFELDEYGNVTIRKGEIRLEAPITKVDAYINQNGTEFSSNWLCSDAAGTTVITPEAGKYYWIKSTGDYYDKIFVWDIYDTQYSESYLTPSSQKTYFYVDDKGNVEANSLVVKSGNIGGCEIVDNVLEVKTANILGTITANDINLGYGNFVVNTSGNVTIKYGSINLGHIGPFRMFIWQSSSAGPLGWDWLNPDSSTSSSQFDVADLPSKTVVQVSSSDEYNGRYFIPDPDNPYTRWKEVYYSDLYPKVVISDDEFSLYSGSINLGLNYIESYDYDEETGDSYIRMRKEYNFTLDDTGELTMRKGDIRLGANSVIGGYNINITNNGQIYNNSKSSILSTDNGFYLGTDGLSYRGTYSDGSSEKGYNGAILLRKSSSYMRSYLANVLSINNKIPVYSHTTQSAKGSLYATNLVASQGGNFIIRPFPLAEDASNYNPQVNYSSAYGYYMEIPAGTWKSITFEDRFAGVLWKKIVTVLITQISNNGTSDTTGYKENFDIYFDNSSSIMRVYIFNGNGTTCKIQGLLIGERDDAKINDIPTN